MLAGGESRRFGRDKASEPIGGQPMAVRAAETLAEVFSEVVVVSSHVPAGAAWPHVPDLRKGHGPLAGIEAALDHASGLGLQGAFVLACDLPLVDALTVRAVMGALDFGVPATAPSRIGTPPFEPLCAAYRVACLPAVRSALDGGELAVHRLFTLVGGVPVGVVRDVFLNVNRPSDAPRAASSLRHRKG